MPRAACLARVGVRVRVGLEARGWCSGSTMCCMPWLVLVLVLGLVLGLGLGLGLPAPSPHCVHESSVPACSSDRTLQPWHELR